MTLEERLKDKRDDIFRLAAKYGAHNVRAFGSVARGEADEASDLDHLVELDPGRSLLDLGGLQFELEALALLHRTRTRYDRTQTSVSLGFANQPSIT